MLFAWAATQTSFGTAVGQFSREQLITGPQAWRAAFVIMALAMVLSRLFVLGVRIMQLRHLASRPAPSQRPRPAEPGQEHHAAPGAIRDLRDPDDDEI